MIQWQGPFDRWKHFQANAFRPGKRHRLVDDQGRLLDLLEP